MSSLTFDDRDSCRATGFRLLQLSTEPSAAASVNPRRVWLCCIATNSYRFITANNALHRNIRLDFVEPPP